MEYLEQTYSSHGHAVVFIYCNYKERTQQTCHNLILSLIRQLIDRGSPIPDSLRSLYDRSKNEEKPPTRSELLELLNTVVSKFSSTFFVIDALDKSNESDGARSMLASGLRELLPDARFLYTSRRLSEIERHFEGCSHLEIRASDGDIRRYLESRISDEPRLSKHTVADSSLLPVILDTIVQKSDGMSVDSLSLLRYLRLKSGGWLGLEVKTTLVLVF